MIDLFQLEILMKGHSFPGCIKLTLTLKEKNKEL